VLITDHARQVATVTEIPASVVVCANKLRRVICLVAK